MKMEPSSRAPLPSELSVRRAAGFCWALVACRSLLRQSAMWALARVAVPVHVALAVSGVRRCYGRVCVTGLCVRGACRPVCVCI